MQKEIRVLQLFGEPFANGGQESFIMNMYRHIDREKVQFDFFTPFELVNQAMRDEIVSLGGRVYYAGLPFGADNNNNFRKAVSSFFKEHKGEYNIVHIHSGSTYALMIGSKIARQSGVKRVVVHSHCGGFANLKYHVIKFISNHSLLTYPTDYFACSHLAARWKFPTLIIKKKKYTVIKNAVDVSRFCFNSDIRDKYRKEFGFENNLVVGHAGRFAIQKNHSFLIDIFATLSSREPSARLVLVGTGELQDEIIKKVNTLGIADKVKFLNIRHDVPELMNMFDVFLLPSFFEGLPVVGVEAQATGLPVVTSTGVTPELPIEDLSTYIPLSDSPDRWADEIIRVSKLPRRNTTNEITACGYEINTSAGILQKLYEGMK